MATTLASYLTSLLQKYQSSEIRIQTKNRDLPYTLWLENRHYDSNEYQALGAELIYCLGGSCKVEVAKRAVDLISGNMILIESGVNYAIKVSDKQALVVKFKLKNDFSWKDQVKSVPTHSLEEQKLIDVFLKHMSQDGAFLFTTTSVMWGSQNLKDIVQNYLSDAAFNGAISLDLFKIIILRNLRAQKFKFDESVKNGFKYQELNEYIDRHYNDISLAQAAEYFGFNRNYFSTMVKDKTGRSFVEHVDERRMKEAKKLLAQPNISLREIIETIGYSSKSFFYKKFKHYYGVTPAEMRKIFLEKHILI